GVVQREDRDGLRVVAVGVRSPSGAEVVLGGQSLQPVSEVLATELELLAVGLPALVVVLGAATAWLVGRSLRAVEAVRTMAALISTRQLPDRVPRPPPKDGIRRLAETMNALLERVDGAAAAQRRFVAHASHELRGPLSTLQVGLEQLETRLR